MSMSTLKQDVPDTSVSIAASTLLYQYFRKFSFNAFSPNCEK